MKLVRLIAVLGLGLGVSACANVDTATRNAPLDLPVVSAVELGAASAPSISVAGYNIRVPDSLRVSEAELFYPLGDIVWRGDPIGDRYAQVEAIFEASVLRGIEGLEGVVPGVVPGAVSGAVPVVLDIEVLRFHGVTNKARYTIGGLHSIKFNLTLRDPQTGAVLVPTQLIEANLKANGGQKAIMADRKGQTQKVRITGHLANVLQQVLSAPMAEAEPLMAAMAEMVTHELAMSENLASNQI